MFTRTTARFLALFLIVAAMSAIGAEDYPSRTVRVIVPATAGGGTDEMARVVARKLSEMYNQQFVVEDRPGAGGVIGADAVAKAQDGYSLLLSVAAIAANHTLYPKRPYDTLNDLVPVILLGDTTNVLVVHPSLPTTTIKEFISLAKARPNALSYASTGIGASAFLATELFKLKTGVKMIHVPYKGAGPALIGILSGETQAIIVALPAATPYIQNRRLRPLAVTGTRRASTAPDIPTMIESGIDMEFVQWYGMQAPAKGAAIVLKLNETLNKMLTLPDIKAHFARMGVEPRGGTPEAFGTYFRNEVDKLGNLIRATGAKVD